MNAEAKRNLIDQIRADVSDLFTKGLAYIYICIHSNGCNLVELAHICVGTNTRDSEPTLSIMAAISQVEGYFLHVLCCEHIDEEADPRFMQAWAEAIVYEEATTCSEDWLRDKCTDAEMFAREMIHEVKFVWPDQTLVELVEAYIVNHKEELYILAQKASKN